MIKKKVCNFDAHGIFINFARITKNVMYYQSNSYLFPNVYLRHNKSIRRSIIQPFKSSYDCHRIFITIRQNNGQKKSDTHQDYQNQYFIQQLCSSKGVLVPRESTRYGNVNYPQAVPRIRRVPQATRAEAVLLSYFQTGGRTFLVL